MEPSTILAAAGAIVIFIIGYLIIGSGDSAAQKRAKDIGTGKLAKEKKSILSFLKAEDSTARRKNIESSLEELEKDQKSRNKAKKSLKAKLIQADLTISAQLFTAISLILGIAAGLGAMIAGLAPHFAAGLGFAVGFGLPRFILNFIIGRRHKKFTANFADSMDIIVRGVRTGLPLGDCMRIIAHEAPDPVGHEFRLLVEAESVGVPIDNCIERMYERVPLPEVNFFGTVLNIQRTTGGNLGESLSNLSKVLRERKMLREKIKALSAEAKASGMIIGALPPCVMALVTMANPDYMNELYFTSTGHKMLMLSVVMMSMGIFVMRKMINFKF